MEAAVLLCVFMRYSPIRAMRLTDLFLLSDMLTEDTTGHRTGKRSSRDVADA